MSRMPDFDSLKLRVPPVLGDLFYDLRDRRLLPLVALVLVALVAAPILLADSPPRQPSAPAAPIVAPARASGNTQLTVVHTDHGLREPGKRLGHLSPRDPFRQQYTGPANGGRQVTQTSTSSTSTTETSPSGVETSPAATPPSSAPPSSGGAENGNITIFTFAIDLKIVKTVTKADGTRSRSAPETRKGLLPPATVPGKKTQVLSYVGISPKTKKPLFLVSPEVTAVLGEAECVSGQGSCQMLELEPHFPLTLVYGPNNVRYSFTVLSVEPVTTGHF
jgi:hypothetical protein